ncbi:MAG: 2Fe-2S iron-sulfur cluster-binding protein [Woeseiaceae bacterium]|nr:2Fe-2S iron-sulfur cluster-binding protein [Woeseiaceae bacterium]
MRIRVTDRNGENHEIEGEEGLKLMEVLRDLEYGVEAICGGLCSCATCHVYVDADWLGKLPDRDYDEEELLDSLEARQPNSRLSCQVELNPSFDGLAVTIAPEE